MILLQFSGLKQALPNNLHLLTLEQWDNSTTLVRLDHTFQNGEDAAMSQPATVNLQVRVQFLENVRSQKIFDKKNTHQLTDKS